MNKEAQKLIETLGLQAHPEGGYFKETYRSLEIIPQPVLGQAFEGDRNVCTGIYFLLTSDTFSAFHRINQDEMWHFYKGSTLLLHTVSSDGKYKCTEIGIDVENGEVPQAVVKAGTWFGATVKNPDSYCFVGCTVSPGFDFRDFELAEKTALTHLFPQHKEIIARLTRS